MATDEMEMRVAINWNSGSRPEVPGTHPDVLRKATSQSTPRDGYAPEYRMTGRLGARR